MTLVVMSEKDCLNLENINLYKGVSDMITVVIAFFLGVAFGGMAAYIYNKEVK